ncbi:8017_t:CDS:2, partial [Cetraspora pellucida]
PLKDVKRENIEFFSDKDRTQTLFGNVLLADLDTTASCPHNKGCPFQFFKQNIPKITTLNEVLLSAEEQVM